MMHERLIAQKKRVEKHCKQVWTPAVAQAVQRAKCEMHNSDHSRDRGDAVDAEMVVKVFLKSRFELVTCLEMRFDLQAAQTNTGHSESDP